MSIYSIETEMGSVRVSEREFNIFNAGEYFRTAKDLDEYRAKIAEVYIRLADLLMENCRNVASFKLLGRDSDEHPEGENAQRLSGEAMPARAESIAKDISPEPLTERWD